MKSALRIVTALLLLLFAITLGVIHLLAIVDPVGTKTAGDGDPFGDPSMSLSLHLVYFAVEVACVVTAVYLLRRTKRAG